MQQSFVYENVLCVRVADFVRPGFSDSDAIESAISYAKEQHIPTVLFDTKDWILDRAVLFYSGVTFIVDGVCMKQADGVFDNIFRSEGLIPDPEAPYGYPVDILPVRDFRILGKNGASIEGPEVQPKLLNCDTGEYEEPYGDMWGWRGISVLLTCCSHFVFSGFKVQKTRMWAISAERASDGYFSDLEIYSNCPNGDGLNLRNGCCRIAMERLKGTTSDDFIAINNCSVWYEFPYRTWKTYFYPDVASNIFLKRGETMEDQDIHDIYIRDVSSNSSVMFLPRNGYKIYNVLVENVDDGTASYDRLNVAYMVGSYYGKGYGDISEEICLSDIIIRNVETHAVLSSVLFRDNVKNLYVSNVHQNRPDGAALTAMEEDDIMMRDCTAVSGVLRNSARDWVNPFKNE